MVIQLNNAGKKFIREWIFRDVDLLLESGSRTVLLGPNGSGKSTLLQLVSGYTLPSAGTVQYSHEGKSIDPSEIFHHVSIAAPYLEVPEELTLRELIRFHFSFKPMVAGLSHESILELSGLSHAADKMVRYFSSGMKQRVRLVLALCSDVAVLLLDEPCSNLDKAGVLWYTNLMERFLSGRTLLVCSNHQPDEYAMCNRQLDIVQWKSRS